MKPALTVVPPSAPGPAEQVRQRIKRAPKPASMLQCHKCGGREVLTLRSGVLMQAGRTKGGAKAEVCALCFLKGDRVVLA